jgi:hypothetical protein
MLNLDLDPQLLAQLESLAQEQGRDLTSLLQEAILLYLTQYGVSHAIRPELQAAQEARLAALRGPNKRG